VKKKSQFAIEPNVTGSPAQLALDLGIDIRA
jgi:hypothetical protein